MKVYCCQVDSVWEDKAASHGRVLRLLEAAMPEPGSLVLLPEMFATGFSVAVEKIADDVTQESTMFLASLAAKFDIYLMGGIVTTAADGRGRNEAVVFTPDGREMARYCKLHPFTFGGESERYMPGTTLTIFPWHETTVAPLICYDLRFPEVFRCLVRRGARLFTVIANWPQAREGHWIALLRARAIENQAYVAAVNRCGNDPTLAYSGRSLIIDPRGEIVGDAGNGETVIGAELDLAALETYRREFPALADIHPEFVRDLKF